ncbi:hypothetical protein E4T50_07832 [Aureobasidium sp. EXF-12298]|nr:hypothetical protein E4T50_07832 [Aureobasidium sp. EXF-12298]
MLVFNTNCTLPTPGTTFVEGPNLRGTLDILWSCLGVLLLCTWSIQHLAIPLQCRPRSMRQRVNKFFVELAIKLRWMLVTLIAPELLCGVAAEEWLTACKSARFIGERAKDDGVEWTSNHGFFAQMGGFRLRFRKVEAQEPRRISSINKDLSLETSSIAAPFKEPLLGRLSFPHANSWGQTCSTIGSQRESVLKAPVDVAIREKSFKLVTWDLNIMTKQHNKLSASFGPTDWIPDAQNGALIEQMMFHHQSDSKAEDVALTAMRMTTDIWTLSLEQIQLARKYGIIETFPSMSKEDLDAISNSDGLAKTLAVCQVLWLIIQMISRAVSNLASLAHDSALASIIESSRSSESTTRSLPTSTPISASASANASNNKHELASPPPSATRHHVQSLPSKVEPEEETQDPPPFASHNFPSLYFPPEPPLDVQAAPPPDFEEGPSSSASSPFASVVEATKAALPQDTKPRSDKAPDDSEPPPPYTEGASPLDGFTYLMAQAGGAASIITQVSQGGPAPLNTNTFHSSPDEHINIDLRGTRFTLSRDELLTLPEFVLLSLFPNGLLPEGHMNSFHEPDVYPVDVSAAPRLISSFRPQDIAALQNILRNPHVYLSDSIYHSQYDPTSLQYMLEFFRSVAQTIPTSPTDDSPSPFSGDQAPVPIEPMQGNARDMLQDRAGIIVLREDLDFYVIPPRRDIGHPEMVQVKRAAGRALLKQAGIFSGLRKSEEPGTTEQHLIEMLTAGGFNHDDTWGHRAGEPNKAVICSIALARLRTDVRGDANSNAVGMAQKLLLFWRKPARRCWWEGVDLENVEGIDGTLKVWIRRVWTLEMVSLVL